VNPANNNNRANGFSVRCVKNWLIKNKMRTDKLLCDLFRAYYDARKNKGFPIGNLTSQLFGNIYLNDFDHFVKFRLGCRYYGRYVDDMVIVHRDKEYLKSIISALRGYLRENLGLELHDKKIYLQHFSKGVSFLGAVIKPYRIYIKNQTKGNFYKKIIYWNDYLEKNGNKLSEEEIKQFISSTNSYLGTMKHYKTYRIRRKLLIQKLSKNFRKYVHADGDYGKICQFGKISRRGTSSILKS